MKTTKKNAKNKPGVLKKAAGNGELTINDETLNVLEAWKSMEPGNIFQQFKSNNKKQSRYNEP